MVSEHTRNDTWELMLDLERQVRYYGTLADRYTLRYRVIRYLLLLGIVAEGVIVYFTAGSPMLLWSLAGIGAFLLGFLAIFDAVTNYAEVSALLRVTSTLCDGLKTEAERLWRDIESQRISDLESEKRYTGIVDLWFRATVQSTLERHDHDNKKAAEEAYQAVSSRYGREHVSTPSEPGGTSSDGSAESSTATEAKT